MIDTTTTDFCQESAFAGMRSAPHVTLKARTDAAGFLSERLASQANINGAFQLRNEYRANISHPSSMEPTITYPQMMRQPVEVIINHQPSANEAATPTNDAATTMHEMTDMSLFDRD